MFLDFLSSNQSGSMLATYDALMDPSLTHQRALSNSRNRSANSSSKSSARAAPRDRMAHEAHHRVMSGPARTSQAFTWAFHWPSSVPAHHVSFMNQVKIVTIHNCIWW